jgi:DNA-binding Lrp family transcriptional regulator
MPRQILSLVPDAPIPLIDPSKFYQTPNHFAMKAIQAKLTSADWCLWSYLQMLDPHGDRMKDIPNPQEIAEAIGISSKQVKRSLTKLEELGLYETKIVHIRGRNLAGAAVKEARTTLPTKDKVVQQRTKLPTKDKVGQQRTKWFDSPAETYTPRDFSPSNTLTYSNQTNQTLSEATRERNSVVWKKLEEKDRNEIRCYARSVAIPKLPIKPTLEENWIASHCNELANQCQRDFEFQKSYYEVQNYYWDKLSANFPPVEKAVRHSPSAAVMGQCQCTQCHSVEEEIW